MDKTFKIALYFELYKSSTDNTCQNGNTTQF